MPHPSFIFPRYNERCFADLPATIHSLLSGTNSSPLAPEILRGLAPQYEKVILLFLDAFGWRFVEHYAAHPFLQRFAQPGRLHKLTSQFPSTTAAHVTCIHSGLPVAQSGLVEWHYYEPQLDALITPLMFSFTGDKERETLAANRVDPRQLFPTRTLYQQLGVPSVILQSREYTPSTYSNQLFQGAEVLGYKSLAEALATLTQLLNARPGPGYYFLYFDKVDSVCHDHGPNSLQVEAEILATLDTLERWASRRWPHALLLLTADHGQAEVDPRTTYYLNRMPVWQKIAPHLKRNRAGNLLVPAGAPRDMFLYVQDEAVDEVQAKLNDALDGVAVVAKTKDLVTDGWFGLAEPSAAFWGRIGQLIILPYHGESVWLYEPDRFEMHFYGHHGGLTPQEMEIPLGLLEFS